MDARVACSWSHDRPSRDRRPGRLGAGPHGDAIAWRRSDEPTTAEITGQARDLLLTIYRRTPIDSSRIDVTGDAGLVDFWLERVGFG